MSVLKAVARFDKEVDKELGVALAAPLVPAPWPLLKSPIKVLSSEMTLCRP
jgi:anti-sigma factor RsiW